MRVTGGRDRLSVTSGDAAVQGPTQSPWAGLQGAARAARERPSFALYLAALALLGTKWLSPISHEQAGWTDVFTAAATAVWVVEGLRRGAVIRLRPVHYAYAVYLAAGVISAAFASASLRTGMENVLIMAELVALAVLTADYARDRTARAAIAYVVLFVVLVAAVEAVLALVLFYLGDSTSLINSYSSYFETSDLYTRVTAGFYSAPLLGSFCIFASAVLAMDDAGLPRRVRWTGQVVLAALVVLTLSRAVLGFAAAIAIRVAAARGTRAARRMAVASVLAVVAVMVALTVVPLSADPLRPAGFGDDTNPRLEFIKTSSETFARHPLLGRGPGSLPGTWQGDAIRAHFTPLNVAATSGPIAALALGVAVLLLWRRRRRPTNVAVWSGLAGLGIDALGQDAEHFRHVWIMLGLADADRADRGQGPG